MQYVSLLYLLVFLPLLLAAYALLPQRHRWKLLLGASYLFYILLSRKLLIYLLLSTASIHHIGLWLERCDDIPGESRADGEHSLKKFQVRKKRAILCYAIAVHIGILLFFKYFNFTVTNLDRLLNRLSFPLLPHTLSLTMPLGISFFTLQAVSYITDVYQKKIKADDNLGRLALYMAFFPAIMEGPICRYSQTADDLYAGHRPTYHGVSFGMQRIVWGSFKKLVIADRLNPLVANVFNNHTSYGGIAVILGAICYTLQLYADFSGCIDISIGTAQMFGVTLPENFRQPFFSRTASEFWRRWHITLGTWFRDYIFYPASLTKFIKNLGKKARHRFGRHAGQTVQSFIPLFLVWFCNGLWHGTGWSYIFYGMYYFVLILLGNFFGPAVANVLKAVHLNKDGIVWHIVQTVKMLIIIFTGELFFRANGLRAGLAMFKSIFTGFSAAALKDGSLFQLGVSKYDFIIAAFGILIMLVVGILHEKGISIRESAARRNIFLRWMFYYAAVFAVVVFGAYSVAYTPAALLYASF